MRGWLIYDEEGAERNSWFIKALITAARREGLSLELKIVSSEEQLPAGRPDFALVRAIRPDLNRALEKMGVPVFNNARTSEIANDKWKTHCLCKELGIPVLPTALAADFDAFSARYGFPLVAKSRSGHGGSQVFCVQSRAEWEEICRMLPEDQLIVQKFCTDPGVDMRIYALDDRLLAAVVRRSETDFRSNFSLGGSATVSEPEEGQKKAIQTLKQALSFDFIGVDFILENGAWTLNELEDPVGTRMLYAKTDLDPAACYLAHIAGCLAARQGGNRWKNSR